MDGWTVGWVFGWFGGRAKTEMRGGNGQGWWKSMDGHGGKVGIVER